MKDLKQFNIQFVGLKEGNHQFDFKIDKSFFEAFNYEEFNNANVDVIIDFVKKPTLLELNFSAKGSVNLPCDVTNELFDLPIEGSFPLVVKFGVEYNDDNEDILIIPHEEYQLNVAQYIYELIVLSIPTKRVHPKVLDGTMKNDALEKLEQLSYNENNTVEEESTDPRWDKLKDLLTRKDT